MVGEKNRFGSCMTCSRKGVKAVAKYRCPACEFVSCSLPCVKDHKSVDKCSGVRDRTKMVSKRNYTENHFMSDLTLLEEAGRVVDAADRTLNTLTKSKGPHGGQMRRLKQEAAKRNIRLSFMPAGLARHSRNTSAVRSVPHARARVHGLAGGQMLYWHVDVYFAGARVGEERVVCQAFAEDVKVGAIVRWALRRLQDRNKRRRRNAPSRQQSTGAVYAGCDEDALAVFLQNEQVPSATIPAEHTRGFAANSDGDIHRYALLERGATLLQTLKGRAIIEYPVLHIARKDSPEARRLAGGVFGIFERPEPEVMSGESDSDSEALERYTYALALEKKRTEAAAKGEEVGPPAQPAGLTGPVAGAGSAPAAAAGVAGGVGGTPVVPANVAQISPRRGISGDMLEGY